MERWERSDVLWTTLCASIENEMNTSYKDISKQNNKVEKVTYSKKILVLTHDLLEKKVLCDLFDIQFLDWERLFHVRTS